MRIGILAPITWRTPPRRYGPWEQVCAHLAAGLAARGHDVTLFATGDSWVPGVTVSSVCPRPLGEMQTATGEAPTEAADNAATLDATAAATDGAAGDGRHGGYWGLKDAGLSPSQYEWLHMAHAFAEAKRRRLDVLHNHFNWRPLAFASLVDMPVVTTLHGAALLEPETRPVYRAFRHLPYVSISDAERAGCPDLHYVATVYNGIDPAQFTFRERPGDYLVFLGRASRKKGLHLAVKLAEQTGIPLVIAAHIPPDEQAFFDAVIRPRIDGRLIRFAGEVGPEERDRLLGGAMALLHLITVPEPFGLVLAEAQACGTPVIGFNRGSVAEVVRHGETGFVVDTLAEAVEAVSRLSAIDRRRCRRWVEQRFTVDHMVEGYVNVYQTLLQAPIRTASV